MSELKIISLGTAASWGLRDRKHFSLLIEKDERRIWIDPSVPYDKPVDFIIITQGDEDHYHYLDKYIEKFPNTKVFSVVGIIRKIPYKYLKPIKKAFTWNGVKINIFSVPPMVGVPAIGIRLSFRGKKVAIIPEFDRLGKAEENLIRGNIWIVGIGEFDTRKPNDHKATFIELIELAKKLKPKKVFLTNLRKNILRYNKKDMLRILNKHNGGILTDGSEIIIKSAKYHRGLYLVKPHAFLIYTGAKTGVLKSRKFKLTDETFLLLDNEYAYGYIVFDSPYQLNDWSDFYDKRWKHMVTKDEFLEWGWKFPVWLHSIKEFLPFEEPRQVKLPHGVQTFVRDAEKYIILEKLHPEEFKREGIDYDMKNVRKRWRECIADLRYLGNSGYPRLKAGKEWGDWSIDLILKYFAKLVDTLRSVYFPFIPPTMEKLYAKYTGKNPEKAKKSSYWQCYAEATKYMESKPPKTIEEAKEWDKKREAVILTKNAKILKKYWTTAKPYYRFELPQIIDELKSVRWLNKKLLIDVKADGLRLTLGKSGDEPFAFVDPETLKRKSPDVSKRLPKIMEEVSKSFPPNTIVDAEFIAVSKDGKEILHRTSANSLLNAKTISPEKLANYAHVFVFDCLFYNGEDLRTFPLHERLEYLQRIKSSNHIWIEKVSSRLDAPADAYIVSSISDIQEAIDRIVNHRIGRPKYIAEGVMIKDLSHPYEFPTNHGWGKGKKYYEYDGRVLNKRLVKGAKKTFNYWIGCDIPKKYYDILVNMSTKDWYHSVGVLVGNKFFRGRDSIGKRGKFVMVLGKTDNTNVQAEIGDIIRIAAEEFLKYENKKFPAFPRYGFYIGRVLENVPEKDITDNIEILNKLSTFQPRRIPVEELERLEEIVLHINSKPAISVNDIREWIQKGKIPREVYEKIAIPNNPLPKELYVKPREGKCWFQHHIRGITQEEKEAYDKGQKTLSEIIIGHSVHTDMRMLINEPKLVQWVFTDNTVADYYNMYVGAHRKTKGGIMNVAHSLALVKPSAEPSDETLKAFKEPAIDKKGAELIEKLDLSEYSYWIAPGDVGSSPYKWAYMSCFWQGRVKTGVARPDYHEYFLYPELRNDDKIFDGRFVVKCLRRSDRTARWEVWKAITDPRPADSILHKDQGYHMPIKASKLPSNKFGRENYTVKLKV